MLDQMSVRRIPKTLSFLVEIFWNIYRHPLRGLKLRAAQIIWFFTLQN